MGNERAEEIIIRESKSKNIKMLLISIGVIALLIWGIQLDDIGESEFKFYLTKTLSIILLPVVVFFIFLTAWKVIKPPPLLRIKENGFEFCHGFNRTLFMDWNAVGDISLVKVKPSAYGITVHTLTFLCVSAKNRKKHVASLSKPAKWVAAVSKRFGYPQVVQIPLENVKGYNAEEVLAIMRKHFDNSK